MSLNSCDIPQSRNNVDKVVNNYGNRLLRLCKTLEVFIVNERLGENANRRKLTCRSKTFISVSPCQHLSFIQNCERHKKKTSILKANITLYDYIYG